MKKAAYWIKEINRASKAERAWRDKAQEVVDLYGDRTEKSDKAGDAKFNILWANTEVMRPALFSSVPAPEVRRRYHDKDEVGREIAKVLERALEFSVDTYDFTRFGKQVANDYLLPGRAVARVRYVPYFEKQEEKIPLEMREVDGEIRFFEGENEVEEYETGEEGAFLRRSNEVLAYEEVRCERVPWKWFRMEPADCWEKVNWVAFGAWYSRDEFAEEWGDDKAAQAASGNDGEAHKESEKDKILVWEIWDKRTRKQYFVADGVPEVLEANDDPLELEQFFPCCEPIYAVETNDNMVPVPEYVLYQYQAEELNRLTQRILNLIEAIKARGAYPGSEHTNLSRILTADDNALIPIDDWMRFSEKGGIDRMISWVPIEQFAKVLQTLEQERMSLIQQIYELTGVSDIMRGATDPRETARAQTIKSQMGNRRLMSKQADFQRFIRDLYRLKAEVIANHFDIETLSIMTGVQVTEEVASVLQNDILRTYRIDIETDSTIAPDIARKQEEVAAAMQAVSGYLTAVGPIVQQGGLTQEAAMELLLSYLRWFRFGRKVDEAIQQSAQQPPKPDPAQQQLQQEMQVKLQELEIKKQEAQMKAAQEQAKIEAARQKAAIEAQKAEDARREREMELAAQQEEHRQEMRQREQEHRQKLAIMQAEAQAKIRLQAEQVRQKARAQKKLKFIYEDGEIVGAEISGAEGAHLSGAEGAQRIGFKYRNGEIVGVDSDG